MPTNRVTVSNAVQLQQALNDAAVQPISVIRIDQDIINVTTPLVLPAALFTPGKHLVIQGNGTTIQTSVPGPGGPTHLMVRENPLAPNPLTLGLASTMLLNRFTIDDITFNGRNSSSLVGLVELTASRSSTFRNCRFINGPNGLKLMYAPETRIIGCFTTNITGISFNINKVLLSGIPNTSMYGSSFTRIENCVVNNTSGSFAGVNLVASGNCVISQHMSIGAANDNPQYHIYFDSNSQRLANSLFIDNILLDNAATLAGIRLEMFGGYAKISGIVNDYDQIVISADSQLVNPQATKPRVFVEHYPIITGGTTFESGKGCAPGDVIWSFFDVDDGRNIFLPTRWERANVPTFRKSEYFDNSNEIVTNSMKVNNNVISA